MPPEVSFNEDTRISYGPQDPYLVRLVKQWGLAKDQRSAEIVLLSVAVGAALLAVVLFVYFSDTGTTYSDAELQRILESTQPASGAPR